MSKRGGYYLNSLKADQGRLRQAIRIGEARSEVLHRIGSSCAEDHDAAMDIKRRMLDVVEVALAEARKKQRDDAL